MVAVLIPFNSTEPHRVAALEYVQRWYADRYPDWPQFVASDGDDRDGWSKATAVANAIALTDDDVFVIADADCICDAIGDAVAAVVNGEAAWASPHVTIRRLAPEATLQVYGGATPSTELEAACKAYSGVPGGGITVVTREAWGLAPMDPRFHVTHGEDTSWAVALRVLVGKPWRGKLPLFHLWHPPTPPMGVKFHANRGLALRYRQVEQQCRRARSTAPMVALMDEVRAWQPMATPQRHDSGETCAVLVPVMRRPHSAAPFMASFRSSAADAHVYAIADAEDVDTIAAWEAAGATVLISDRGHRFAQKVNVGFESTAEPWVFLVGDDVVFHPGWLATALAAAGDAYDMVSTNDGARNDLHRLAIHPLIRRRYVDQLGASWDGPGLVAHEGYNHWCPDLEWSALALERGVFTYEPAALVEHMHPLFGKGEDDEVYGIAKRNAMADRRTFAARQRAYMVRTRRPAAQRKKVRSA